MASPERDSLSGQLTTGHEWDGIKELRTPIPNWWLVTFVASWLIAVGSLSIVRDDAGLRAWSARLVEPRSTQPGHRCRASGAVVMASASCRHAIK